MKRSMSESEDPVNGETKRIKVSEIDPASVTDQTVANVLLDENLLYEILKHVDAKTLGGASCVSKQWNRTAQDERLWELICTKHWTNMACGSDQLRSVVLALGGFRRLHAHYLWPLSKPSSSTAASPPSSTIAAAATVASGSVWPCLPPPRTIGLSKPVSNNNRWGKDEVQLSLCLLSIRFYEKMNYRKPNN